MPLLVERVDMTEKGRGICRLLFSADTALFGSASTSANVLVNPRNRAVGDGSAINHPISNARVARIRTDQLIIRPKRKGRRQVMIPH